ncbi:hypothetical protein MKW94_016499 [Papaver nudicaule]|uniref:RING-type domain-containing protein n=1 Tax=Papaver nudicaule TaxID=74823 RepID=A0AA41VPH6_PAPNU|nr:hypothetical protein [Papaver nudicaule]
MMNKTSSIVLQKAEEGLRGQHNHSQCSTSSSEVSSPEIPSILPHNKNTNKSTNKPSSNLLVTYLENIFIAVSLSLFFVFITVLTLFVHFIVTCKIIIHRLRQPRRTTRINTASGSLEEEEEEILNFCSFGFRLTQGDLKNLSSFSYGNVEAPQDCIVCLESLREGEICRSLPKCKHNFHADCVDSWLIRVPSCPMCREIVVKPEVKQLLVAGRR